MAALHGSGGAVKLGGTSATSLLWINTWTLNETKDEAIQKPMAKAYTSRLEGHTDWTVTINCDLDYVDTDMVVFLAVGVNVTVFLYTKATSTVKGRTGAGIVFGVTYNTPATDKITVDLDIRGNAALAAIV